MRWTKRSSEETIEKSEPKEQREQSELVQSLPSRDRGTQSEAIGLALFYPSNTKLVLGLMLFYKITKVFSRNNRFSFV